MKRSMPRKAQGMPEVSPRSVTLLNPITVLLTAVNEGRIQRYLDVVELSK